MPIAEIQLPNGKIAEIEVPEGASNEQIVAFAESQFGGPTERQLSRIQQAEQQIPMRQGQPQRPIGRVEAGFTTLTNAIPFSPRIKAAVAAGTAKGVGQLVNSLSGQESFGDLYDEAFKNEISKLNQARSQYPVQSLATEIAGSLPLTAKLPTAATKSLGTIGLGAVQSVGEGKDLKDVNDVAKNAILGGTVSGVAYGAGKIFGKGYEKFVGGIKTPKTTADDLRNMASNAYQEAENKGGILKKEFVNKIIDESSKLDKQTSLGKAIAGKTPINEISQNISSFRDQPTTLKSLQELDEALGDKIDNLTENGRILKDGLPLLKLQNSIRKLVDSADPSMIEGGKEGFEALKRGRELWAKSAKLRDVERIITKAELSDNPATTIKNGFRTLYTNQNKLNQYTPDERELIKKAAQSGFVSDSLRMLGSRLIPIGTVIAGGGLPSTMASIASSTASRGLSSKAQLIKAENLAEAVIAGKATKPKQSSKLNSVIAQKLGATTTATTQ